MLSHQGLFPSSLARSLARFHSSALLFKLLEETIPLPLSASSAASTLSTSSAPSGAGLEGDDDDA